VSIAQGDRPVVHRVGRYPVRIILVRDDAARDGEPCHLGLVTTDTTTGTAVVGLVVRYASCWSIEVMFSQIRNLFGAGQARNRVQAAVERTFSFQLAVYSIVVVWYVLHACSDTDVRQRRLFCPWYRTKTRRPRRTCSPGSGSLWPRAPFSAITPGQRPSHENPIALVTLTSAAA
jgi:hypothetical protein